MAVLKKSDILQGIHKVEQIHINELDGELWLRPLSSAEIDECSYIETKGMGKIKQNATSITKQTQTLEIDAYKASKATDDAKYEMIRKSLDNPKNADDEWTTDDIKQLSVKAVNEIYDHVRELSGVEVTSRDVKNFPEDK